MTTERRYAGDRIELRENPEKRPILAGYALKFDRLSQDLGGWVERIAPTALNKTLADAGDVLARFQHADEYLLGRTSSGTLRLSADATGLFYEVELPDTDYARNLAALAQRGDLRHSSFAFRKIHDEWSTTDSGYPLRTLTELQLRDVAPVVEPAYLDTSTGLRSLAEQRGVALDEVRALADAGRLADIISPHTDRELRNNKTIESSEPDEHHSLDLLRRRHELMGRRPLVST